MFIKVIQETHLRRYMSAKIFQIERLRLMLCIDHATQNDIMDMEETVALISFYTKRGNIPNFV